ncbi:hypothetical protein K458DRAFT_14376 [Lentithecium fluviatile CBS 122367]|uniref:Uncharacterized protein n=1 Tax=Lentithecium fluviatile CBS 122367 TaxID=1168545 RepID=A0A6G1J629_9PLEO|nr:hypothetical protein K458DRAFT_14376 [Lentithecium fluviatile CBS 122367]
MAQEMTYSHQSGQVYTEVTFSAKPKRPWWNKSRGRPEDPKKHRKLGTGTSSLYDAALRVCTYKAEWLTPEALISAEWPHAERIYKRLKEREALTFKVWKAFQDAFPDSAELDHTYHARIAEKRGGRPVEIDVIQKQITTLPFAALTNLNLRHLLLRHVHLMGLTNLTNLAVLALEQDIAQDWSENTGINAHYMKRWGLYVQQKGTFMKLRVVVFRHFQTNIESTLACFQRFPQLLLCNIDTSSAAENSTGSGHGTPVPSVDCWQRLVVQGAGALSRSKNPRKIWTTSKKTIHERMKMLYDLASVLSPSPRAGTKGNALVSIHYGDELRFVDRSGDSAWFVREAPARGEVAQSDKRPSESGGCLADELPSAGAGTNPGEGVYVNKKRKIRGGKQMEIGSILGVFGQGS